MEPLPDTLLDARQRHAFTLARRAAARVVQRRLRLYRLLRRGYAKLSKNETELAAVVQDLRTLLRLVRRWASRDYRSVPWRSVLYAVAALIYFVNPADLLPDALAGIGFVDDVTIVAAVVHALRQDLQAFRAWETTRLDGASEGPLLLPPPS